MYTGMIKSIFESAIAGMKKEPANEKVKNQCDVIAEGLWNLPDVQKMLSNFMDLNLVKQLLYNLNQDNLDELYIIFSKAIEKR